METQDRESGGKDRKTIRGTYRDAGDDFTLRKPIDERKKRDLQSVFCQMLAFQRKDFISQLYLQYRAPSQVGRSDFNFILSLGRGSFGSVFLVRQRNLAQKKFYAMKVLEKKKIAQRSQIRHALEEKRIMGSLSFPFVITLIHSFQDNANLFLVMPYMSCGDLFAFLGYRGSVDNNTAVFLTAQVVLAIEYLHDNDVMYRDLKPENILMDTQGYLKIADFGFAKIAHLRAWTFCGTPEYIAPEVIKNVGYSKAVDWWALGVLLYEMLVGRSPFHAETENELFDNILTCTPFYPPKLSEPATDLLKNLLAADPTARYGNLYRGIMDIKCHHWFYPYEWLPLLYRAIEAPFIALRRRVARRPDMVMAIPQSNKMLYEDEFRDF